MSRIARMQELLASLQPSHIEIIDDSSQHAGHAGNTSGAGHYRLHIVSSCFSGLNILARQRMIYSVLGEMMQHEIHALSINALTPEQI